MREFAIRRALENYIHRYIRHTLPFFHLSLSLSLSLSQVISRIFYVVDRNWNGRITTSELRRSNFLQVLVLLEDEPDINQITNFFSYEHFYVIYCKFWELDTDHDLVIDAQDLSRHEGHGKWREREISKLRSSMVYILCLLSSHFKSHQQTSLRSGYKVRM